MRILFANSRPSLPFTYDGGSIQSTFSILMYLASRGWDVKQLCTFPQDDPSKAISHAAARCCPSDIRILHALSQSPCETHNLVRGTVLTAFDLVTAVHSVEFVNCLSRTIHNWRPDLLVTWLAGSADAITLGRDLGIKTLLRVLDVNNKKGYPSIDSDVQLLANSPMAAQYASQYYGRAVDYIVEPVEHSNYICEDRTHDYITFINPQRAKGLFLFAEIVDRLPHRQFLVVTGWSWSDQDPDEIELVNRLKTRPNIAFRNPTHNMQSISAQTRLLLVPSRWPESWGRVVQEAQANGIPVVVSNRGSLPLNVGPGGVVIDYGKPDIWANVIEKFLASSKMARIFGMRAERNVERFRFSDVMQDYEQYLRLCIEGRSEAFRSNAGIRNVITYHATGDAKGVTLEERGVDACGPYDLEEPDFR